jgi:hypothetical protein
MLTDDDPIDPASRYDILSYFLSVSRARLRAVRAGYRTFNRGIEKLAPFLLPAAWVAALRIFEQWPFFLSGIFECAEYIAPGLEFRRNRACAAKSGFSYLGTGPHRARECRMVLVPTTEENARS